MNVLLLLCLLPCALALHSTPEMGLCLLPSGYLAASSTLLATRSAWHHCTAHTLLLVQVLLLLLHLSAIASRRAGALHHARLLTHPKLVGQTPITAAAARARAKGTRC